MYIIGDRPKRREAEMAAVDCQENISRSIKLSEMTADPKDAVMGLGQE